MKTDNTITKAEEIRNVFMEKASRQGTEIAGNAIRMMREGRNFEDIYGFDTAPAHYHACEILKQFGYHAKIEEISEGTLRLRVTIH